MEGISFLNIDKEMLWCQYGQPDIHSVCKINQNEMFLRYKLECYLAPLLIKSLQVLPVVTVNDFTSFFSCSYHTGIEISL